MNTQSSPVIDFTNLSIQAGSVFHPNTPVTERELFSGRKNQIKKVTDVIFQLGQHAIIFGERGVGKTSLANVLQSFLPSADYLLVSRINCYGDDTFNSVWKKIFDGISFSQTKKTIGYKPHQQEELFNPSDFLTETDNIPYHVIKVLGRLSQTCLPVVIIDEFDRLMPSARKLFADFIKSLSDYSIRCTMILIGVGESIEYLIQDHQSVSRSLVQIQMPRMNEDEVGGIFKSGLDKLGMQIDAPTLQKIKLIVKGLPYYAHLIGLHSTRNALDEERLSITESDFQKAITISIEDTQHLIKTNYLKAIRSTKKDNLFFDVLLACAHSELNEAGEFSAADLRLPMKKITGHDYNIPAYAKHLKEFCDDQRDKILTKTGVRKKFRYKFTDPLMQPFVIMQGVAKGRNI